MFPIKTKYIQAQLSLRSALDQFLIFLRLMIRGEGGSINKFGLKGGGWTQFQNINLKIFENENLTLKFHKNLSGIGRDIMK